MGEGAVTPPYPPEIISHAVWLYFRFSLSFRDIEERTTHSEQLW
jgi:transposase-like protein